MSAEFTASDILAANASALAEPTRSWSPQQSAIFDWMRDGSGHLVVRARAGTGKTTTILEAIRHAPETAILVCAFNKAIAEELQARLTNPNAEAKTLHSLGFGYLRQHWRNVRVDSDRGERLAKQACGGNTAPWAVVGLVKKLASLAKGAAPDLDLGALRDLAEAHECYPTFEQEEAGWTLHRVVSAAAQACTLALQSDGSIDYDDMLFVPVKLGMVLPRYDLVVVDEAQDMNATQLLLAQRSCKGRLVVVGDDRQAIYAFRGADGNSIDRLKKELRAAELGLTVTYRCPTAVVAMAQRLVPDLEAAPNAAEGVVREAGASTLVADAQPGDFILSRKNAPLAGYGLQLIKAGKRAKVAGRDIARTLINLIRKWKVSSVGQLLERLATYQERENARAAKLATESKQAARRQLVADQVETLVALADGVASVRELEQRVETMFTDDVDSSAFVLLSSIHKAKGQERERVFLLVDTLYPGGRETLEEQNLEYVAVTRAKRELVLVRGES